MKWWALRPKAVIPLTTASTSRAHVAHVPLRRLSEAALSACSDGELLALFAAEARGVRRELRGRAIVYLAIVVGLAVSVVIGSALADAAPGAWL